MVNIAKLALPLVASMIAYPHVDPDLHTLYDGNLVGLCDMQRREILPTKFSRIDYIGHGLYICLNTNSDDPYEYGRDRAIYTKDGKQLKTSVPPETKLAQVFWLGAKADQKPDSDLSELSEDTLLRFVTRDHNYGLCKKNGEVVLPAKYAFIGKASQGKAFVTDRSCPKRNSLYLFNATSKSLKRLPFANIHDPQYLCFSEGLAALNENKTCCVEGETVAQPGSLVRKKNGYIDESGNFVITGDYIDATCFHDGYATVVLQRQKSDDESRYDILINKSGKIVSPSNLDVSEFHDGYAIAKLMDVVPPLYGIVNRKFEFVVQPKYEHILAHIRNSSNVIESQTELSKSPSNFYRVQEKPGAEWKLITRTGQMLFTLPQGYFAEEIYQDGTIRCRNWNRPGKPDEEIFFQRNGQRIANYLSESTDAAGHHIQYRPIAEDRYLKCVSVDDGRFDSNYFKRNHDTPITRQKQWGRFLREYNLIGMSRDEVINLLGPGWNKEKDDNFMYSLTNNSCTEDPGILIKFKNDKVERWCITNFDREVDCYGMDMVFEPHIGTFIPKFLNLPRF